MIVLDTDEADMPASDEPVVARQVAVLPSPTYFSLTSEEARLRNAFASRGGSVTLQTAGGLLHASITSGALWATYALRLRVQCGALELRLAVYDDTRWHDVILGLTVGIPQDLRLAAAAMQLQPVTDCVAQLFGGSSLVIFAIDTHGGSSETLPTTVACLTRTTIDGETTKVLVDLSHRAVAHVALDFIQSVSPHATSPTALSLLPVPLAVRIAAAPLYLGELLALDVGDTVVVDSLGHNAEGRRVGELCVLSDVILQRLCSGYVRGSEYFVDTLEPTPIAVFATTQPGDHMEVPIKGTAQSFRTNQIELTAQVLVPALSVRLEDVERWQPGTIVSLAVPVGSDQLRLRVGIQTVARGKLVDIDNLLGFEIVELLRLGHMPQGR
jgi:flagellar motor switch/type III secretory pathway protein FliN